MSSNPIIPATNWTTLVMGFANINALKGLIGPFRPPQWNQPQVYSLTVTQITTEATSSNIVFQGQVTQSSANNPNIRQTSKTVTYFFDAILRAEHNQELVETEHPIQDGASVVDHCYLRPAQVTLEIGMSDCMARYVDGQFTSNSSKSISAYETLLDIQSQRIPITLATRLKLYENMVIKFIRAVDTRETQHALRVEVTFVQLIVAQTATNTIPASARPDATDLTNEGTKQVLPPSSTVQNSSNLKGFPQ